MLLRYEGAYNKVAAEIPELSCSSTSIKVPPQNGTKRSDWGIME